jgi:two-component system phosphate regulon sensor histidine kinase PhoR
LAIVKHIAQAHGGKVGVESSPGQGSTFTVFLQDDRGD